MRSVIDYLVAWWGRVRALGRSVIILRVPVFAAVGGLLVMNTTQMREAVSVLSEDFRGFDQIAQPTLAFFGMLASAFAIWFCGRMFSLAADLDGGYARMDVEASNLAGRRVRFFLALLPVAISAGYLTFCLQMLWREMAGAGHTMTFSAFVVLGLLVIAAGFLALAALVLIIGVFVEARSEVVLDGRPTRWLFGVDPAPSSFPQQADTIDLYILFGRTVRWLLSRIAGPIDRNSRLAATYGLAPPSPFPVHGLPGPSKLSHPAGFTGTLITSTSPAQLGDILASLRQSTQALQFAALPPLLAIVTLIVSPALFLLLLFQMPGLPEAIGTVAIVQVFVVTLLLLLGLLHRHSDALILAIVVALVVALFDWNDTHHIRPLAGPPPGSVASAENAFAQWLASRKDRDRFDRYPVYIVAAPGGGIYAAYHAAIFLARMQDSCPGFAQHVFAISSVSGGSLGAGVFAALAKTHAANTEHRDCLDETPSSPGPIEQQARTILAQDFLSPAVAAALFPDLALQMAPACPTDRVPFLCLKGFDRARALEVAFEDAWPQPQGGAATPGNVPNPLAESYYSLWSPTGATPALLVNTTSVETGERVVVAPFRYLGNEPGATRRHQRQVATLLNTAPGLDLRLSTAIGISARFPGISPAAWYRIQQSPDGVPLPPPGVKRRLVDGGYFDNSGIATALDTIDSLSESTRSSVRIRLIVLSAAEQPSSPTYYLSELLSVARALLNTRVEHGRRIEELVAGRTALSPTYALLDTGDHRLPLGWQLARGSREAIEGAVGRLPATAPCPGDGGAHRPDVVLTPLQINACTMAAIRGDLMSPAR